MSPPHGSPSQVDRPAWRAATAQAIGKRRPETATSVATRRGLGPAARLLAAIRIVALLAAACVTQVACSEPRPAAGVGTAFDPAPTRGYILISIDTLSARHLGAYGYERDTSPFLDSLAARGTLFERAVVQYPATLLSHMSIFTGLYPREHGVMLSTNVLSPSVETLPERLRGAGFRTFGHTEGGFMAGDYGFGRGFDEFTDTPFDSPTNIERTLQRGLDSIAAVGDDERFFLFLHTYSVHDPYDPPEPERSRYWSGPPPDTFEPNGPNLHAVNKGFRDVTPEAASYFEALYDASIRYADGVLEDFVGELEARGLADEITLIVTSDHGEEFLQHGRLSHDQIYPELIFVPLIVVHPRQSAPIRIPTVVQSIDLAPTIEELAGLDHTLGSGRSLVPLIRDPTRSGDGQAHSEVVFQHRQLTLIRQIDGRTMQLLTSDPDPDPDGAWISREVTLDTTESTFEAEAVAFHRPRLVHVEVDGRPHSTLELGTDWQPLLIELGRRDSETRVRLWTEACQSPLQLGVGEDPRCHSFKLRAPVLRRVELFDLTRDPGAQRDVGRDERGLRRRLAQELAAMEFEPAAPADDSPMSAETEETLRSLGYID